MKDTSNFDYLTVNLETSKQFGVFDLYTHFPKLFIANQYLIQLRTEWHESFTNSLLYFVSQ
jgi:hypothetical protein